MRTSQERKKSTYNDEFQANAGALAFSARDTLDQLPANNRVGARGQSEFRYHALCELVKVMLGRLARQTQLCGKANRLSRGRCHLQGIVLCDKANLFADINVGRIYSAVVQTNVGCDFNAATGAGSTCENVQEGSLAENVKKPIG
jgi:hypothetical protein